VGVDGSRAVCARGVRLDGDKVRDEPGERVGFIVTAEQVRAGL
jgi:hypothetical protein